MISLTTTMDTPTGPFTILSDPDGVVLASGFTPGPGELTGLVHPALRPPTGSTPRQVADLGAVTRAVRSYLAGDLHALDQVVVRQQSGGAFLSHAWDVLRKVPPGSPVTYASFAALAGRPAAIRAAAQACARNAAALFVPCHRVLRTDGSLGGFRWGLPVKSWLLEHETERLIDGPDRR